MLDNDAPVPKLWPDPAGSPDSPPTAPSAGIPQPWAGATAFDPGLFGPGSVSWRVHSDPSMAVAGIRALLLQALHPLAMAGVAGHSSYRSDCWGRLARTADYVAEVTYGTTDAAHQAAARVRAAHSRVSGVDPATGRPYRADDPGLLLWVHVTEIESFLSTARRCGLGLTGRQADTYLAEQVRAAELVGIDPLRVPASRAEVDAYYRQVRPELRVTPTTRSAVSFILSPPMPRWVALATPARPAWFALSALAVGMLPRWARRLYGLSDLPPIDVTASLGGAATRAALLALPRQLREAPHLREARQRLGHCR